MRCRTHADLAQYAGRVMPWLVRDPIVNNVICTILEARTKGLAPVEPDGLWLTVEDTAGNPLGAAIQTPPRALLLGAMPIEAARALADHIAVEAAGISGVNGPVTAAAAFRDAFAARTGASAKLVMNTRMFRLTEVIKPGGVPGRARAATASDRDLLVAWSAAFSAEATPDHPADDPAMAIDARLANGLEHELWVWEVDGTTVSTARLSTPVAGVSRISGVYTPPARRGNGYASACVAAATQYALDHGPQACMLYTNLANPTSNKIYQAIGYQPVVDVQEWKFVRPAGRDAVPV
jgi:predicted GNAT family acetyltransferase